MQQHLQPLQISNSLPQAPSSSQVQLTNPRSTFLSNNLDDGPASFFHHINKINRVVLVDPLFFNVRSCSFDCHMSPLCNCPISVFPSQFPPQYPTVHVMTAVTDCDSSCSLSCNSPHPASSSSSSSSHKPMFLSPGHAHPLVPTVSPISPLHIENLLVAPIPVSLIPSPSHMLDTVGPASPRQPSPSPALPQGVKSEICPSQLPAFVPTVPTHPLHSFTGQSQSTHLLSNGSPQPLMKVIIMAAM